MFGKYTNKIPGQNIKIILFIRKGELTFLYGAVVKNIGSGTSLGAISLLPIMRGLVGKISKTYCA